MKIIEDDSQSNENNEWNDDEYGKAVLLLFFTKMISFQNGEENLEKFENNEREFKNNVNNEKKIEK